MFTNSRLKECYKLDKGKCLTPMESLCRFWFPKVEIQMLPVGMHLGHDGAQWWWWDAFAAYLCQVNMVSIIVIFFRKKDK